VGNGATGIEQLAPALSGRRSIRDTARVRPA